MCHSLSPYEILRSEGKRSVTQSEHKSCTSREKRSTIINHVEKSSEKESGKNEQWQFVRILSMKI